MTSFTLSLLTRSCLLALTASSSFIASADVLSPWRATDGALLKVTRGYSGRAAQDYPLFASGAGSRLETASSGLSFDTTGNLMHAAYATAGGAIQLDGSELMTNGIQAHGALVDGGKLVMQGGSILLMGQSSAGAYGKNGAELVLEDLGITTQGSNSRGITLDDGSATLKNVKIAASGANNGGMAVGTAASGSASVQLETVDIAVTGKGYRSGIELGNGELSGKAVTIAAGDEAIGVNVYNSKGGYGKLALSDSRITTQAGDGIYILNGEVALTNTDVTTQDGKAVNVNTAAQATIRGGSFTTHGDNAAGLWIATPESSADVSGASFTTYGAKSHAFYAQTGSATIADSTLKTAGANSYGLYTESEVQGKKLTVDTLGPGGIGVFAARGGQITLDHAAVTTRGEGSTALLVYPGSGMSGKNMTIDTTDAGSRGLWVREGALTLSDSLVSAQGEGSVGLHVSNGTTGTGSQVVLDNVQMSTNAGPALKTDAATLALTLKNGTQIVGGNNLLLQDESGEATTGSVAISADNNVRLQGDIVAAAENQVDVALSNRSQLIGAIQGLDSLALDSGSVWTMTGNSQMQQLKSEGLVTFRHDGAEFSTLTLDTLEGHGSFAMNTDIAALRGDLIEVRGTASGTHQLFIHDTGAEPEAGGQALTVVKTGGGDEQFTLNGGSVDVGTWQYELKSRGDDWVLMQKTKDGGGDDGGNGGEDDGGNGGGDDGGNGGGEDGGNGGGGNPGEEIIPVLTPTAKTAIGLFNATPTAWYGELTTMRTRMGEVRHGKQQGGAWVRLIGNEYDVAGEHGVNYQQRQSGMALGVDGAHPLVQSNLLTGLFTGFSNSSLDFGHGSRGTIDSYFIGGYATWLHEDGWYVDAVAKANNFNSHAEARMSSGERATGGYSAPAFGLTLEAGRQVTFANDWFVEPSVQLSGVWVKGDSYRFSNQLQAQNGNVTSQQAALTALGGKTFELNNGVTIEPWLRASLVQEFSDSNAVSINGNHFNNDMSGRRGEYGAGVSVQATETVQVYADARYAKGDKIESPWGGNLGVRWTW